MDLIKDACRAHTRQIHSVDASEFQLHAMHEAHSIAEADIFHFVQNPVNKTENLTLSSRIGRKISTG